MSATAVPLHDPWPGVLNLSTIALMNGSPNAGKTALLAGMLQRLAAGGELFGFPVPATPVFFIAMDRLWHHGAFQWFDRYGFGNVPHYSFVDDRLAPANMFRNAQKKPAWEAYAELLERLSIAPGTLVASDPYENAWGNVMDRGQVITASTVLQRHLADAKLAQLGMMHSAKMKGDSSLNYANVHEQMAGTGALSGYSSAQITLLSPKQSTVKDSLLYELHITAHGLPQMIFGLTRDTEGRFLLDQAIRMDEAEQRLLNYRPPADQLAILSLLPTEGRMSRGDLASILSDQFSRATVYRLITRLLNTGYLLEDMHGHVSLTEKALRLYSGPGIADLPPAAP